jgi:hypothetical protein
MMSHVSRHHFLFGTLLTAAIPRSGFGSMPSLTFLGYQSPNKKMNIAVAGRKEAAITPFSSARRDISERAGAARALD